MAFENAFEMASSSIRFGAGVTREIGMDLSELGLRKTVVVTDSHIAALPIFARVLESLEGNAVPFRVFDRVRVEPSYESLHDAIRFTSEGEFDSIVAVGGGSTIDTAKAANLYSTYPVDDF